MADTNQPNSGTIPDDIDVSQAIQDEGAIAEDEIFLKHLLGVNIPRINDANVDSVSGQLANRIASRILNSVDVVRSGIDHVNLPVELDQRIKSALRSLHGPILEKSRSSRSHLENVRAVSQAVREVLPPQLINQFLRNEMPVALSVDADTKRHELKIENVKFAGLSQTVSIFIDTNHSFWREQGPFEKMVDLVNALKGRKIDSLGIRLDPALLAPGYILQDSDVYSITKNSLKLEVISLSQSYPPLNETIKISSVPSPISYRVNIDGLVAAEIYKPDSVKDKKYVGNLNLAELKLYLSEQDNWKEWIHGMENRIPTVDMYTAPPAPPTHIVNPIAEEIFKKIGATPSDPLAVRKTSLLEIQNRLHEQHRFYRRLREGNENYMGAAFSASILMKYKDKEIHDILNVANSKKLEQDLSDLKSQKSVNEALTKFSQSNLDVSSTGLSYSDALKEVKELNDDMGRIGSSDPWKSKYMVRNYGTRRPPSGFKAQKDEQAALAAMQNAISEAEKDVKKYDEISLLLRRLKESVDSAKLSSKKLEAYFVSATSTAIDPKKIDNTFDIIQVAKGINDDLTNGSPGLQNETKLAQSIALKEGEIKKAKEGGAHGAEAQHKVIAKYLELYQGLTAEEAKSATNYIRANALLSADLTKAADDVAENLYGGEGSINPLSDKWETLKNIAWSPEKRSKSIVYEVAFASGVKMQRNDYDRRPYKKGYRNAKKPQPDWQNSNYRSLIASYFALKSLYEGKGPSNVRLQQRKYVQDQMKIIARTILAKHSQALLKDFGPSLNLSDEKQKEVLKEPTKREHIILLEEMLSGNTPEKYSSDVQKAMGFAEKNVDWLRYTILNREDYGLVYGKNNKISARNLLYGNKYASAAGLYYRMPKAAIQAAGSGINTSAKAVVARRRAIAIGAAIGTLALPGFGTAIGGAIGGIFGKKAA